MIDRKHVLDFFIYISYSERILFLFSSLFIKKIICLTCHMLILLKATRSFQTVAPNVLKLTKAKLKYYLPKRPAT